MPDSSPVDKPVTGKPTRRAAGNSFPLGIAVALGVAALIFAVIVILRVAGPLAGLLAPAEPPFFEPATLLEHRSPASGVDEWLFATDESGCAVYLWYAERATVSRLSPMVNCLADQSNPTQEGVYSIGYCQGSEPFGNFASDWEIYISDGYNDADGRTRFLLAREVDWINQN